MLKFFEIEKDFFSINVQIVTGANLKINNIVSLWSDSAGKSNATSAIFSVFVIRRKK